MYTIRRECLADFYHESCVNICQYLTICPRSLYRRSTLATSIGQRKSENGDYWGVGFGAKCKALLFTLIRGSVRYQTALQSVRRRRLRKQMGANGDIGVMATRLESWVRISDPAYLSLFLCVCMSVYVCVCMSVSVLFHRIFYQFQD